MPLQKLQATTADTIYWNLWPGRKLAHTAKWAMYTVYKCLEAVSWCMQLIQPLLEKQAAEANHQGRLIISVQLSAEPLPGLHPLTQLVKELLSLPYRSIVPPTETANCNVYSHQRIRSMMGGVFLRADMSTQTVAQIQSEKSEKFLYLMGIKTLKRWTAQTLFKQAGLLKQRRLPRQAGNLSTSSLSPASQNSRIKSSQGWAGMKRSFMKSRG